MNSLNNERHEHFLVVNASNVTSRGGITVLVDCLRALSKFMPVGWWARAYVPDGVPLPALDRVTVRRLRRRLHPWIDRLWFEIAGMAAAERNRSVDVFLSLQGASARIPAKRRYVYCHQPLPFMCVTPRFWLRHPRFAMQRMAYSFLYRFGIGDEDIVIVQQDWMRDRFHKRYGRRQIVVARPLPSDDENVRMRSIQRGEALRILAPLAAQPHKDVETAIEIARLLAADGVDFEMSLTLDGSEGAYGRQLSRAAAKVPQIRLVGYLSRREMDEAYQQHHLLLFPSLIETWGLPLSEGKRHSIGIVAVDHPYAREALGTYDGVAFFSAGNADAARQVIADYWLRGRPLGQVSVAEPAAPFAPSWEMLVRLITAPAPEGVGGA